MTDIAFIRPNIGEEEIDAAVGALRRGQLAQGSEVAALESEFAAFTGSSHAVAVSSGTAALELALEAAGIGAGDEVIVPAFTFIATAAIPARLGATVRFADVDEETFCVTPETVAAVTTERTKAVIPVHLFGYPAPMRDIRAAVPPSTFVLGDAAQAHGAEPVAEEGTATFSFYPTKNMAVGEGGMVTTDSVEIADRIRLLRNHGMHGTYEYVTLGTNARMTDVEASIGRVQLRRLPSFLDRRRAIADRYRAELRSVKVPTPPAMGSHAWACFTIRSDRRDALQQSLADGGIATRIYYPEALHRLPVLSSDDRCPVAEHLAATVLSLPMRPDLTDDEVDRVVAAVNAA